MTVGKLVKLINRLRDKQSRDNRELLDLAADTIEQLDKENIELKKRIVFWQEDIDQQLREELIKKNHALLMAKEDIEKCCRTCLYRADGGGCKHPDGMDLRSTVCTRWKWRGDEVGL